MAILGLGTKTQKTTKDDAKKSGAKQKPATATSQADEAKALLAKMQAKKDGGDCPFC